MPRTALVLVLTLVLFVSAAWAAKGGKGNSGGETHDCRHTKFAAEWESLQNADRVALGIPPMHHDCRLGELAEMICDNIRFEWGLSLDEMMTICGVTETPMIVGLMGSCRSAECWWFAVNALYPEDLRIILSEHAEFCGEAQWSGNVLIACYGGDFTELIGE